MVSKLQQCQVCSEKSWLAIATLHSGIWDKQQTKLARVELDFPIGECEHCGHVQVITEYNEYIFSCLYFSDVRAPAMFFKSSSNEKTPYQQMIDFFQPYLTENSNIVDFGCGSANIFKEIKKHQLVTGPLTGIDFNPIIDDETVNKLLWDINSLQDLPSTHWPSGIDLAVSTHVLEHVINPVAFLSNIAKNLSTNGKIFIEVPDCSHDTDLSNIAFTSVVHGQHIHYYTKDSIAAIAQRAGLKIIKSQQIMTREIPRLLIIMEISNSRIPVQAIKMTASSAVKKQLFQVAKLHDNLAEKIITEIDTNGCAGIWGIGGDAFLLLKNSPRLRELLKQNKLIMFDYELASHHYFNQLILSSSSLSSVRFTVYMTPILAITREKMALLSQDWDTHIIDPYTHK